ncbi:MAG: RagB/SusD family nutrient uptake outer membrane protein [Saprospiraceae bacterium]|nr:MAG: RagB/SusD family nutrient uptake outer membrane protein [Saprospiraceae bacterium]
MMKSLSFSKITLLAGTILAFSACFKDLDTVPLDKDEITSAVVYDDPASYKKVLAKVYAGLSVSGQEGPSGQPDISGIDEGFGQYLRGYWYLQELPTDEAVIGWNDRTIKDLHEQDWDALDVFVAAFYSRIFYQIVLCNEFLRETTDAKLDSRNVDAGLRAEIQTYRAEVRFLRALSYWHALDLFRSVPFVTEADAVGAFFPQQISKEELFNFIEVEAREAALGMAEPHANEYGRADKAAAWMLLAKLYLNAEVYIGQPKYTECITYCNNVINAGYSLNPNFSQLFMADNHQATDEVIFPITFDGINTKTWGGTTFLVHAAVGGSMNPSDYGIDGGWAGTRTTSALVGKFPAVGGGSVLVAANEGNTGTYPVLQVPGSYQGWDPTNTNTVIASPGAAGNYEGYFWFDDGTEFKITDGPSWDVNYGDTGADGTLDLGGDNLLITGAGYYKLNVDLNALTYTLQKTDWGLIGSATADGWNSDQNMTYNATENAWTITADLVAGEVKFRANDDWALNYGDTGADALLEEGGDNIIIPSAGSYLIKLYIDKPDYTYSIELPSFDKRAMFYTNGQSLEIGDISKFTSGYAVTKFSNRTSTGSQGSDVTFCDTDFPLFRLADTYLMYAEAVLRGGSGGDMGTALDYINQLRERAYGSASGNITQGQLTLDFILDERARELLWEGSRRTDLVRFGRFSESGYLWPWKGGVKEGTSTNSKYNIYPIPASDLGANPNLVQNPGY